MKSVCLRRLTVLLGLSAVCFLALVTNSAPAFAHAQLIERDPAPDTRLDGQPGQVRLLFSEPVEAAFEPIKVRDAQGERVDQDNARVAAGEPEVIVVGLDELAGGSYTVDWRVTSVDGHVVDGSYEFSVKASAEAGGDAGAEAEGAADSEAGTGEPADPQQGSASEQGSGGLAAAVSFGSVSLVLAVVVLLALGGMMLLRRGS